MKLIIIVVVMASLTGSIVAEDSLEVDRRSSVTGLVQIFQGIVTGFGGDKSGFDEGCNYFPQLTQFSNPEIHYVSKILNNWMCDSGFTKKLAEVAKLVNLLLKAVLTEFGKKKSNNEKVSETPETTKTQTTSETQTTTTTQTSSETQTTSKTQTTTTTTETPTTTVKAPVSHPYLFVNTKDTNILIYEWSPDTKTLTLVQTLEILGNYAYSMILDATRKIFVAAITGIDFIDVFNLDVAKSEKPKRKNNFFDSHGCNYAAFDHTDKYLLASAADTAIVYVFELKADGTLDEITKYDPNLTSMDGGSEEIAFHPKAKGILAQVVRGKEKVVFLKFDSTGPALTKLTPEAKLPEAGDGTKPYRLVFSKDGQFMYVACQYHLVYTFKVTVNEATNDVVSVEDRGSISTVKKADPDKNLVQIVIHPDGTYLYVLDVTAREIAMYSINTSTGQLTSIGYEPTNTSDAVDQMVITNDGTTIILGSYDDGLVMFDINPDDGKLKFKSTFQTADQIMVISFG